MDPKKAIAFAQENNAQIIDFRFTDLPGTWQHFSMPAATFDEELFEEEQEG